MKKRVFLIALLSSMSMAAIAQQSFYDVTAGNGNGIRFWQADAYKIHMGNSNDYKYGFVTDYSIKFNMNNDPARGWTWGVDGLTPVASINTQGNMQIAGDFNIGNTSSGETRWLRAGLGTYSSYPINFGSNNKSGFASIWDTDGVFFGLSDEGANRKDVVIAWGDDGNDMLRFIFNNSELMRLTPSGSLGIGRVPQQDCIY